MTLDTIEPFLDYFERVRERTRRVVLCVPPEQLEWAYKRTRFITADRSILCSASSGFRRRLCMG